MNYKGFRNKKHYDRFMWAWSICQKINAIIDDGGLVFNSDDEIMDKFCIKEDDERTMLGIQSNERCFVIWLGSERYTDDDSIYVNPKKEIREMFKGIKYVMPEHIMKFKIPK